MKRVVLRVPILLPDGLHRFLRDLRDGLRPSRGTTDLLGDRDVEWSWMASRISGPGAGGERALDFGPGASWLGLLAAERGWDVLALDREEIAWPYMHPRLRFLRGDILEADLPAEGFGLILSCSTVEHVGLAGRYGATQDRADGDLEAMARLRDLLRPGGRMVLTIPCGRDAVFPPYCRVYGEERLPKLLAGYESEEEAYWVKDERNRWIQAPRATALAYPANAASPDPMRCTYALGCFVLRKPC